MAPTSLPWLAALVGLFLGSFVNVVALRDDRRRSILTGRSHCPHCRHQLAWIDLIPLLSYVTLLGRCRYCRKPLSLRYPTVELLSAALTAFAFWQGAVVRGSTELGFGLAVVCLSFLTVSLIDLQTLEVPVDYVALAGLVGGMTMLHAYQHTALDAFLGLLVGAGAIAAVLYGWRAIYHVDGMGVGDIWIAGALGAILGYPLVLVALGAAVFTGAALGLMLVALKRKSLQMALPFGPFLSIGLLIALTWGQTVLRWYIL